MKKVVFTRLSPIILSLFLIQMASCGTVKSIYKSGTGKAKDMAKKVMPGKKSGLRKKILVVPIMDQAGIGEEKAATITGTMVERLKRDGHYLVQKSAKPIRSKAQTKSPQYSIVIDQEMSKRAEEMGMNVLIMSVLNPFEVTSKRTGIWPFRKFKKEFEISMLINALDITSGTIFLTNLESRKIKITLDEDEFAEDEVVEEKKSFVLDDQRLDKELSRILQEQVSVISDGLDNQPWTGRIVSVDTENVIINAGKDVGITVGVVLDVFGKGESIRSSSGKAYHILGPKIGEIKVVEVMEDNSSTVPLTGDRFQAGQITKLKD